jgi:hypothetical protein
MVLLAVCVETPAHAASRSIVVWAFEATLWRIEQSAAQRQLVGAMAVGEKPVMANAVKAIQQDVKEEMTNELASSELHRFVFRSPLAAIILPAEDDMLVRLFDEPAIADGDPVGVAGEIGQDLFRPGEGTLGVDYPFTAP